MLIHDMTFDDIVKMYDIRSLSEEQKKAVLSKVHVCAKADNIAIGDGYILIEGGNLEYYAGLEYCKPLFVIDDIKLYEADYEDQAANLNESICEIVFGNA